MKLRTSTVAITIGILGLLALLGCQRLTNNHPPDLTKSSKLFSFEPSQVQELTMVKSDPYRGDHWTMRLQHSPSNWKISSISPETSIKDTQADEIFVSHLLDSFRTLRIESKAPNGSLDSFGLNPPQFAFQWRTESGSFEFQIGSKLHDGKQRYFTIDGEHVYVVNGSALRLIDQIQSYQSLRKQKWINLDVDDVDEIEVYYRNKPALYAQREGDIWTNQQHKPLKQDVNSLLTHLIDTHVAQFVDDHSQSNKIQQLLNKSESYRATFTDRTGKKTTLLLRPEANKLFGTNSTRPSGVFQLNPRMISILRTLSM
jgi:hypothetical protein